MAFLAAQTVPVSFQNNSPMRKTKRSLGSSITCGISSSCATSGSITSCQAIYSLNFALSNSTLASTSIDSHKTSLTSPLTKSNTKVSTPSSTADLSSSYNVLSTSPQTADPTANPTSNDGLSSCGLVGGCQIPTSAFTTPSSSVPMTTISGFNGLPACGALGGCATVSPSDRSLGPSPTSAVNILPMTANTILPIVMPSVFIVVCVVVFSVVGNRRKWISRAYHARRWRRNLTESPQPDEDSVNDTILLRDLRTPPPAYSPYHFSQADREWLGFPFPVESARGGGPPGSETELMGHAYPSGDSGRHRST